MGFVGNTLDALSYWLEHIAQDAPEALKSLTNQPEQIYLDDACYWSAHYCDRGAHALELDSAAVALADMSAFSNRAKRKLALLWEGLREKHKFAEADVSHYNAERQRIITNTTTA